MATPTALFRFSNAQTLQPAQAPETAKHDAVAFGPNQTITRGQTIAIKTADRKGYAYSSATLTAPTAAPALVASNTGGTLPAATYYYKLSALYGSGNSAASPESSVTTTGATSMVKASFPGIAGATGYNLYRSTATGAETFLAYIRPSEQNSLGTIDYSDTGAVATTTATPPTASTPASDGTQVCVGLALYSFTTDATGAAFDLFGMAPGQTPATNEFATPDSTIPYAYKGVYDPRELVGFDATAMAQLGGKLLADGNVSIP